MRVFIPDPLALDPDAERRARMIVALAAIVVPLGLLRIAGLLMGGFTSQALLVLITLAAVGAAPVVLRHTASLSAAGSLVLFAIFLTSTRAAYARGGIGSPALIVLGMLPLIATFLAGRFHGALWTIAVLAEVAAFGIARAAGYELPDQLRDAFLTQLSGALLFPLVMLGLAFAYEWTKDRALEAKAQAERDRAQSEREAAMLRADRMASVGQLAAGIAHEANNPLGYVLANLSFIEERLSDPGTESIVELRRELSDAALEARQGAERIARVVRDLKTVARPDVQEVLEAVSVCAVLDSALKVASNELKHRAEVAREYADMPVVLAEESRLAQIFLNLLLNAAQALPEGKAGENRVHVSVACADAASVCIRITDTGCGIAPEHLSRVTEPFFTTKPVGVGTGLGLSVCKSLIEAMAGSLAIESDLGRGTSVCVTLPCAPAASAVVRKAREEPRPELDASLRILVVDDDPLVRRALARVLRAHSVTSVGSGREAVELVGSGQPFDVILCDVMMPELTGVDVYERIFAIDERAARSIVFLTGGAFAQATAERLERLPNARLEKPLDIARLDRALRTADASGR